MNSKEEQNQSRENCKKLTLKIILLIILISILCYLLYTFLHNFIQKNEFENDILKFSNLNQKDLFYINRIYLFSSANATNQDEKKPFWNLNISQYTDIAIYISSIDINSDETKIKKLTINNIHFEGPEYGTPALYYKNMKNFGKFLFEQENKVQDSLSYKIVDIEDEIDYSSPQIDSNVNTPLTLSYINSNIKKNHIITDISQPLIFDGSILQRSNIPLSNLSCNISFNLCLTNLLDEKFIATISIPISLKDNISSIYDGKFIQDLNKEKIKFHQVP